MLKGNQRVTTFLQRFGYVCSILIVVYVLSAGPVIAIGRTWAASPVGVTPGLMLMGAFYEPLFWIPPLVPVVEFYINLWDGIFKMAV